MENKQIKIAAKEYALKMQILRAYKHDFKSCKDGFTAGANFITQEVEKEAVEFAEWISFNRYMAYFSHGKVDFYVGESEYEWYGEEDRKKTTSELYKLYKATL